MKGIVVNVDATTQRGIARIVPTGQETGWLSLVQNAHAGQNCVILPVYDSLADALIIPLGGGDAAVIGHLLEVQGNCAAVQVDGERIDGCRTTVSLSHEEVGRELLLSMTDQGFVVTGVIR
ncbi:hypothetical protein CIG75_12735 [Tumebacillus algifaecis]|uniref:Uncharacterized protein n=1 Tax=Tumebacillus algifaecis TaxID=1214604 RepID=A0A223D2Q0_9BACL|nr:hypothetical protein [Tumebacillus algifaecis]ASS75765.1 hypothetical protein CIG75_12735 [Tumebacillus algifaecis]